MYQIKNIETGNTFTVSQEPVWIAGTWECGDRRFMDPTGTDYEAVPDSPVVPDPPKVSPVEFKLLWTPQERVAIKGMRAADPVVDDFYNILDDPRLTLVNLALQSTQDAVDYLLGKLAAAAVIQSAAVAERRTEILSGVFR